MNPSHEETACLYVLDQLEPAERAAFEQQLAHDAALAARVRELADAVAHEVRGLPAVPVPPAVLARLERQLDQEETARPTPLQRRLLRGAVAAAVLLAVGLAGFWRGRASAATGTYILFAGLEARQSTLARVAVKNLPPGADARFVELASLARHYWDQPADEPVKDGHAYAVFDPGTNQGFIAVRALAAAPAGKRYHVWVVDTGTGAAREAGALPAGAGLYFFSVAPEPGTPADRLSFRVTAEDAAAAVPAVPRGQTVLGTGTF